MPVLNEVVREAVSYTITPELGVGFGKIKAEKMTDSSAREFAEQVTRNLVVVDLDAPSNCIDGRKSVGLISGDISEVRPSLAGGAGVSCWIANELLSADSIVLDTPDVSYANTFKVLETKGKKVGGHCDSAAFKNSFEEGKTGCGAADRAKDIVSNIPNEPDFVSSTTKALLGQSYDASSMKKIVNGASILAAKQRLEDWHGADMLRPVKHDHSRTEILAAEHNETHGHSEQAVIFNYLPNTSFDRDQFVETTGKQAFAVDMWYIKELATTLGNNSPQKTKEYLHALTAYQVATYITLCNGSHRAIILNKAQA